MKPGQSEYSPSSRSGQMTVLLTFLMFVCVLILGFTLNIAELFILHGHLQTSVDCAVYSGAVIQAKGLNDIAKANTDIANGFRNVRSDWNMPFKQSYSVGFHEMMNAANNFIQLNQDKNRAQILTNNTTSAVAIRIAKDVAKYNEPACELTPIDIPSKLTELQPVVHPSFTLRFWYNRVSYDARGRPHYIPTTVTGPTIAATVFQKGTPALTHFCAKLAIPARAFIFTFKDKDGKAMTPTSFPGMRVYAAAMPYGGCLWDGRPRWVKGRARYDAKLVGIARLEEFQPELKAKLKLESPWAPEW